MGIIGGIKVVEQINPGKHIVVAKESKQMQEKEKQTSFLRSHESEMTDFVKKQNSKVKTIQYDWNTVDIEKVENGLPQGAGQIVEIHGIVNKGQKTKDGYDYEFWLAVSEASSEKKLKKGQDIYFISNNLDELN